MAFTRDTSLGRTVAVNVLPEHGAIDPFSLNHDRGIGAQVEDDEDDLDDDDDGRWDEDDDGEDDDETEDPPGWSD